MASSLPIYDDFAEAVKAENYRPLPADSVVGFSDVVGSTQAVAEGRYGRLTGRCPPACVEVDIRV